MTEAHTPNNVYYKIRKRIIIALGCVVAILQPISAAYAQNNTQAVNTVELSGVIRVRTALVRPVPVGGTGLATGVVNAYRKATVAAEVPGRIIERLVEPGTQATAGQVLVRIDPDRATLRLRQSQAMADARRVDAAHAKHEYLRSERLLRKKVVSQDTVDDLRFAEQSARAQMQAALVDVATAQRNLEDTTVTAPFAGQIETVHVQVGDYVNPGQPILTQTDFSKARLIAGVTSREASIIHTGDVASAVFDDLGGIALSAQVTSVGRIKDQTTGTYPVELMLTDTQATPQLREGMIGMVAWQSSTVDSAILSVPSAALVRRDGQISLYTVDEGHAHRRQVRIGKSDGKRVEILAGLEAGQEVVIEGQFALRDGAAVEINSAANR